MLAKFFQKHTSTSLRSPPPEQPPSTEDEVGENVKKKEEEEGVLRAEDINPRVNLHYGIPSTASLLAFDPIQSLLAVATLDGRIKVIGGNNIEGLLVSPMQSPFKHLEFIQNQGFLVSVSNDNEIQVWDLEQREIASTLRWESSITAFSVIYGSCYMYVGDEYGMVYVLKYDADEAKLKHMPYYVPTDAIAEASGMSLPNNHSVVGILPQPSSEGSRVLIAYEDGLIVLWDSSEDKVILVRGNKDLKLKSKIAVDSQKDLKHEACDDISDSEWEEKEISSLCWASPDGSILAVGYVDGDIMLWNLLTEARGKNMQAKKSSNDVVKLQLSSADRRLPVIVLRWSASINGSGGELFVYGGDSIGSEEVLTILSLDWSSGIEKMKCKSRVDLTLAGSFADMVLLPSFSLETAGVFLLTNPGQLHFYDNVLLSSLMLKHEKKSHAPSLQYPMVIPAIEPYMTVGKLGLVNRDSNASRAFCEKICAARLKAEKAQESTKWPLTGGIPNQPLDCESHQVERLYLAGYQDGSVRVWDATYPTFSIIYVLGSEGHGIDIAGATAPVSALELCSVTLSFAIGNELGMIRLYKIIRSEDETSINFITETGKEVLNLPQVDEPQCTAVFSFIKSPVRFLKFINFGTSLVVGFHSGHVAVLDVRTSSVFSLTESILDARSPVNSVAVKSISDTRCLTNDQEDTDFKNMDHAKWEIFLMTNDAQIVVVDDNTRSIVCSSSVQIGKESTVISMFIIEDGDITCTEVTESENTESEDGEPDEAGIPSGSSTTKNQSNTLDRDHLREKVEKFRILLCCEDALYLYSLKSLNKGDCNPIQKVQLLKPCCWATTFKKDDKEWGIIVLHQSGVIEIRSLVDLQVVGESSLMSTMRWNLKPNMEKTICSSDSGQIILVNGCEFASLSLLAHENDFRIPEFLPCLHDKVLTAAVSLSPTKKKIEVANSPSILGGLVKRLQAGKMENHLDLIHIGENGVAHLERIFSNPPFLKPSFVSTDDHEVVELSIDDIDIDGPLVVSSSSEMIKEEKKGEEPTDRERLFEGGTAGSHPRPRTVEEIKAKYRKEDPTAAASQARDKLLERQEKLERLSLRTQEMQDGAENFASMAAELAKQMEKKKWWNL